MVLITGMSSQGSDQPAHDTVLPEPGLVSGYKQCTQVWMLMRNLNKINNLQSCWKYQHGYLRILLFIILLCYLYIRIVKQIFEGKNAIIFLPSGSFEYPQHMF